MAMAMAMADKFQNKTGYAGSRETGVSGFVWRDVQYFVGYTATRIWSD